MFELFEHTADLGLRVLAASLEGLLAEAAQGLLAMHVANPEAVRPVLSKTVELAADDPTYLLFDWLSELLFAFESEKLLLSECDIHLQGGGTPAAGDPAQLRLTATCRGEPMDEIRHRMEHEVKAITYHGLTVEQQVDGSWFAELIVDI
jgi:SHS2 domain-containing protein